MFYSVVCIPVSSCDYYYDVCLVVRARVHSITIFYDQQNDVSIEMNGQTVAMALLTKNQNLFVLFYNLTA